MLDIKKPNLKAPRFRKPTLGTLNRKFISKIKQDVPSARVYDDERIKTILRKFNENVRKAVIDNRDGVELPEKLGRIFVGSCYPPDTVINYRESAEKNQKVLHKNWETDGFIAKIFYLNRGFEKKTRFKNQELWGFDACRKFKRGLASVYPQTWKKYAVIRNDKKLALTQKFQTIEHINKKREEKALESYNEFEL